MLSWLAFSVAVMLAARLLIAVGLGRYVDTNKNNRGKLACRVEGSASDSQSFKFWRTGGGENHLWLTIKLIPQPLDLFDRSGDLSARKSV